MRGDIKSLLDPGQMSVSVSASASYALVPNTHVKVTAQNNQLKITVDDPGTLGILFSSRPAHAILRMEVPGENPVKDELPIIYL